VNLDVPRVRRHRPPWGRATSDDATSDDATSDDATSDDATSDDATRAWSSQPLPRNGAAPYPAAHGT
jgi:hypothetical protein